MPKENFPVIESEKEKTREELLEEFIISLKEHGVEGVEVRIEGNNLILEQKYGEGIRGLSRSNSSVWICLDQKDPESFKENNGSNANTNIDFGEEYSGIIFEKNEDGKMAIRIDTDHPVAKLASLLGKNNEVYLPGDFNKWKAPDPLDFDEKTKEIKGVIERGTVWGEKKEAQCKIAIHIKSEFDNGEWEDGADQKMEINLEEEDKEE